MSVSTISAAAQAGAEFLLGVSTYEMVASLVTTEDLSNTTESLASATEDADTSELDVVWVVACFLSVIAVFGILSPAFSAFFRASPPPAKESSQKMRPPVGASIEDFINAHKKHQGPYWFLELFRNQQQHGVVELKTPTLARIMSGGRFYACFDVRTARKVMEDPGSIKWDKGFQFFVDTASGVSIASECLNGPRWKHVRKSTSQAFSPQNIRLIVDHIDEIAEDWVEKKVKPSIESGEALDILADMNFLTAQIITRAAFDYVLTETEGLQVLKSLQTCFLEFGGRSAGNMWRSMEATRWMFQGIREGRQAANYLFEFCTKVLMCYRLKTEKKPHMIIDLIENDTDYANDHERICDLVAYMIAGFDTTANTLSFCLKELAMNPEEQDKLRLALRECSTKEEARYCPAIKNVIREALRLHPAAANGSMRITGSEIPVEGTPFVIPAKSLVVMPFYAMQRNESVFENPDDFQPSRWEDPSESMLEGYIPFAAGKRSCQGQAIAYAEMDTILSRVLSEFEFQVVNEGTEYCPMLHEPVDLKLSAHYAVKEEKKTAKSSKKSPPPSGFDVLYPILKALKNPAE